MTDLLAGKVALVTGAARGIGLAYATALAESQAAVLIADIRKERLLEEETVLSRNGMDVLAVDLDVGSETSVQRAFEIVKDRYGRLDILVNNAAIMVDLEKPFKPFWQVDWAEWKQILDVNAGGVFLCCKYAKPLMEQAGGGRIVNISSDGIWQGYEGQLPYFASKGAVAVMTRCLARELGSIGVNVNCIAPGYTLSEAVLASAEMQAVRDLVCSSRAIPGEQYPEDLIGALLFLCSPASGSITGQTIVVNGGAVMP